MRQTRFIAGRTDSFEQAAALFAGLLKKHLPRYEKRQVVHMVDEIGPIEDRSEAHAEAIHVLTRRMGLVPTH
jgi:hypothetical protein